MSTIRYSYQYFKNRRGALHIMRKTNSKGFTIIELLVVIVIIGILVALALPQLFAAQARGRDTERKNDLKNIKTQLETYFNDKGVYPSGDGDISVLYNTTWTAADREALKLTEEDLTSPRDTDDYVYDSDGNTYTITATLENKSDSAATDENGTYIVESVNQEPAEVPAP